MHSGHVVQARLSSLSTNVFRRSVDIGFVSLGLPVNGRSAEGDRVVRDHHRVVMTVAARRIHLCHAQAQRSNLFVRKSGARAPAAVGRPTPPGAQPVRGTQPSAWTASEDIWGRAERRGLSLTMAVSVPVDDRLLNPLRYTREKAAGCPSAARTLR